MGWRCTRISPRLDGGLDVGDQLQAVDRGGAHRVLEAARRAPCRWPWPRTSRGRRRAARPRRTRSGRWPARGWRSPAGRGRPPRTAPRAPDSTRCAITGPSVPAWSPSTRMANSSPPMRATVSPTRTHARSRSPTDTSRRSPTSWPRLSFTVLKSSRSTKSTDTGSSRRCSSAWSRRSRNSARLASCVSGSWNAWNSSCPSRSRSSATVSSRLPVSSRFSSIVSIWRRDEHDARPALDVAARNGPIVSPGERLVARTRRCPG